MTIDVQQHTLWAIRRKRRPKENSNGAPLFFSFDRRLEVESLVRFY